MDMLLRVHQANFWKNCREMPTFLQRPATSSRITSSRARFPERRLYAAQVALVVMSPDIFVSSDITETEVPNSDDLAGVVEQLAAVAERVDQRVDFGAQSAAVTPTDP